MPRTPEQRLKAVEEILAENRDLLRELCAVLLFGKKPSPPRPADFSRVYEQYLTGDHGPINEYISNGGKIPEVDGPPRRNYQPRKRPAHSLLPPEMEANPATTTVGILQDAKRGTLARHRRTARPEPSGNAYANAQRMGASGNDTSGNPATDPRISCGVTAGRDRHRSLSSGASFGQPKPNQGGYASP